MIESDFWGLEIGVMVLGAWTSELPKEKKEV